MANLTYDDLQNPDGRSSQVADALDTLYMKSPIGSVTSAITQSFHGINHRQTPGSIPINRDYYGFTFFTRPRMNMTTDNLRKNRLFAPLLSNNKYSIPRAVRAMLDIDSRLLDHSTPLIDDYNIFMPILTNQLISISGWPDIVAPTYSSKEGAYKEAWSMVDGVTQNYSIFNITANFRNISGDPITALFLYWIHYMSLVYQGIIVPYPDMIIRKEFDSNTRIYRLILDPTRRFVQKIAACGAAFPTSVNIGNYFNYESDTPINRNNDQITISFQCMGAIYQDDALVNDFNRAVNLGNNNMGGTDADRSQKLVKLEPEYLPLFNYNGYPRIDPDTYELQWWVNKSDYTELINTLTSTTDNNQ